MRDRRDLYLFDEILIRQDKNVVLRKSKRRFSFYAGTVTKKIYSVMIIQDTNLKIIQISKLYQKYPKENCETRRK